MNMTKRLRPDQFPPWYDGQSINEAAFCREFLASHKLLYTENSFFTPEGRMTDEAPLKTEIYQIIEPYASGRCRRGRRPPAARESGTGCRPAGLPAAA